MKLAGRIHEKLRSRVARASVTTLATVGGFFVLATAGGGLAAYRTYDYVQHDNDFCVSCHLMQDPFDRFQVSAHRDMSCKACHQPSPIDRFAMGMRQVLKRPVEITAHAEMPDSRCEHCHVDGDPAVWLSMENSRGHDLHLNSKDETLRDIHCVDCHSTSVHQFSTTSESCSTGGCHDDAGVHLGAMGELRLSCEACHDFRAPLGEPAAESGSAHSLTPTSVQCLACHDMRERVEVDPESEPHGAECGLCHNAHTQRTSKDPVRTCTESLCHGVPEAVEDNHHHYESVDLDDCVQCHEAHTFRVDGKACATCHADIAGGGG
jgi:hypothetical protein